MHPISDPGASSHIRAVATRTLRNLQTKFVAHGFVAHADRAHWSLTVVVKRPDPDEPGKWIEREQRLQLGQDDQRNLRWYLVWPADDGPGPDQFATRCGDDELDVAVETVARLLLPAGYSA